MDQITELWNLPWGDGLLLTFMLMALYTYKVWRRLVAHIYADGTLYIQGMD